MGINPNIYYKGKSLHILIDISKGFLTITRTLTDKKTYDLEVILNGALFNICSPLSNDQTAGRCINENITLKEWQEYRIRYRSMPLKSFYKEIKDLAFQLEKDLESDILFDLDPSEYA